MNADPDTLATARYVPIDDMLIANPVLVPDRPTVGIARCSPMPKLLTMAVLQALLGFSNEARLTRYAQAHPGSLLLARQIADRRAGGRAEDGIRARTQVAHAQPVAEEAVAGNQPNDRADDVQSYSWRHQGTGGSSG